MLVANTGAGKTECYKVLKHALTALEASSVVPTEKRFCSIKTVVINPKTISIAELYGEENIDTRDWTDGLASKTLRKFAKKAALPANIDKK